MSFFKWLASPVWGLASSISGRHRRREDAGEASRLAAGLAGGLDPFAAKLQATLDPRRKLQFLSDEANIAGHKLMGEGATRFRQGVDTLGQPLSYYQGLLGNRQEAMTAAGPDISTIKGQARTAAQAVREFTPRGGGRISALQELPYTEGAAIQSLLERQRPAAAEGVTRIGSLLSSLGISEQELGLSEMGLGTQQLEAVLNAILQGKQIKGNALGQAGQGAGSIIAALLL